jgi:hypothetical protein
VHYPVGGASSRTEHQDAMAIENHIETHFDLRLIVVYFSTHGYLVVFDQLERAQRSKYATYLSLFNKSGGPGDVPNSRDKSKHSRVLSFVIACV